VFSFRPNFIFGGENAERGSYPFVAALGIRELSGRVNLVYISSPYYHIMCMYKPYIAQHKKLTLSVEQLSCSIQAVKYMNKICGILRLSSTK